jgi:hypothetical protein
MPMIDVDSIAFTFPDGWKCSKYDDWLYYRAYSNAWSGTKAVDLLAIDLDNTAWFIEVKDYRAHRRTKSIELCDEVAQKVHDTLAVVLAARTKATDADEKTFAGLVVRARKLRVVLHLEQPAKHSKLFPRPIDPTNVKLKMRTLLKQIDAHPAVVEISDMGGMGWIVSLGLV